MKWVEWAQKLQAISQNGLTYSRDKFDIERYRQIRDLSAEIIASYTDHDFKKVKEYLTNETGYATPKIDVRGVVFRGEKILLVKEIADDAWTVPGGWADIHETPSENAEREVFEESGYRVKAKRLLALYDRSKHDHYPEYPEYVYKLFFLCEIIGGSAKSGTETSDVRFFSIQHLPRISISRVTRQQILRLKELENSNRTDFD